MPCEIPDAYIEVCNRAGEYTPFPLKKKAKDIKKNMPNNQINTEIT
jgi:hypothetical protein